MLFSSSIYFHIYRLGEALEPSLLFVTMILYIKWLVPDVHFENLSRIMQFIIQMVAEPVEATDRIPKEL